jgi:hypothetical protein
MNFVKKGAVGVAVAEGRERGRRTDVDPDPIESREMRSPAEQEG